MIYPNPDSEDAAIEQPTIALFEELGWETRNCYHERVSDGSELGRQSYDDVVLVHRLRAALEKLNPDAAPLALELNAGFVPVRKPGKLPFDTHSFHYELEYGTDSLEMHTDAVTAEDTVLLVDDLLATGGTMQACVRMTEKLGAQIAGVAFAIELDGLNGRKKLEPYHVFSLVTYSEGD